MQLSSIDAQKLRLMAFDVDGVMTDGRIYFSPDGEALKVFNTLDGHGLKKLAASGVTLAIITGRNTPMVAKRAADLAAASSRPSGAEAALSRAWSSDAPGGGAPAQVGQEMHQAARHHSEAAW